MKFIEVGYLMWAGELRAEEEFIHFIKFSPFHETADRSQGILSNFPGIDDPCF